MKMLKLSKNDGTPIATFEDYNELYIHIRDMENSKLFEDHPEFGKTKWSFMVLSPERVVELSKSLEKRGYDPETLSRAMQERSGIIEMCQGDENNPHLVIASPGVDIEGFRNDFCDDYCHAHKLILTECDY